MTADQFWRNYLATLPAEHPAQKIAVPDAWGFGDSPALADELGELVFLGTKTATCSSLWEHEHEGSAIPKVGQYDIVLDGQGRPWAIIQLTEVAIRPYDEVDAAFAYDEGEGDRSLEHWREGHWRFFSRTHAAIGREVSGRMPLVCQRFKVVYRRYDSA